MLAVRYLTLTALVIWVGGLVTVRWLLASTAQAVATLPVAGYVCGAVMLLGLLVLKFVGPPPHAFVPRAAIVAAMLALQLASDGFQVASTLAPIISMMFGFGLLFWYVRE